MSLRTTIYDLAKTPPRMSKTGFNEVLTVAGSPWASVADTIYDMIVANEHDPAFWLGIALKEHTYGTNPSSVLARGDTNSWTNARTIRHPNVVGIVYFDPIRKSAYIKYETVFDSILDGMYRLDDPTFVYQKNNAHNILDVINLWAPAGDNNKPEGYAQTVADKITEWSEKYPVLIQENPMSFTPDIPGIPVIPADSRHYTKGRTVQWPDTLIQHHTDGYDSLNWLTVSPSSNVSSTYLLWNNGDIRAQLVRHADTPHTTGYMNPRSISCEWERKWPNQQDVPYAKLGAFWAHVIKAEKLRGNPHFQGTPKREQMKQHKDFFSTTCAGNIDMNRVYDETIKALGAAMPTPTPPATKEDPNSKTFEYDGKTFHIVNQKFGKDQVNMLDFYEKQGGILMIGLPLEGMSQDKDGNYRQICENAILEYWPKGFGSHKEPIYRFGRYLDHVDRLKKQGL
jgi:hypothetical protein